MTPAPQLTCEASSRARGLRAVRVGATRMVPLDRAPAEALRRALDGAPRGRAGLVETLEAPRGRYLLGGRWSALRRVWIGEEPEPRPSEAQLRALEHAARLQRVDPRRYAREWVDGASWPPTALEVDGPPIHATLDATLGVRVTLEESPLMAAAPFTLRRSAAQVARALTEGLYAHRWSALAGSTPADLGTSALDDLAGGGACFVFARLWTRGASFGDYEYALWLDPAIMLRADRFALMLDRYGAFSALHECVDDAQLWDALRGSRLPAEHELLFSDAIEARHILRVSCRDDRAREALLAALDPSQAAHVAPAVGHAPDA